MWVFHSKQNLCIENFKKSVTGETECKYPHAIQKSKQESQKQERKKENVMHFQALITLEFVNLSPKDFFFFFFAWPAMIAIIWTATFIILLAFEGL